MDTLVLIVRYGLLVALAVEAVLIGRAFLGLVRAKALATSPAPVEE